MGSWLSKQGIYSRKIIIRDDCERKCCPGLLGDHDIKGKAQGYRSTSENMGKRMSKTNSSLPKFLLKIFELSIDRAPRNTTYDIVNRKISNAVYSASVCLLPTPSPS